jgi:hypothetical protein
MSMCRRPPRTGRSRAAHRASRWSAAARIMAPRAPRIAGLALIAGIIGAGALAFVLFARDGGSGGRRAVIIDQLAATDPNPGFVRDASAILKAAGYHVDYYGPEAVKVDLYRHLPARGDDLIIVRSHSLDQVFAPDPTTGELKPTNEVGLFTNEPYSTKKYVTEQRQNRFSLGFYPGNENRYFAIQPGFVRDSMSGQFERKPIIILMGCGGLSNPGMAQAFESRGGRAFVSWSGNVTPGKTDESTLVMLRHLLADDEPPAEAAAQTMAELGPDSTVGSTLLAYP